MRLKADSRLDVVRGETLVRFFTKEERRDIPSPVAEAEWSAGVESTLLLHHKGMLCVGLGDKAKVTEQTLRVAAGTAVRTLQKAGRLACGARFASVCALGGCGGGGGGAGGV